MDQILDLLPSSACNFQLFSCRYVQMCEIFPCHACHSPKFWTFLVLKGYFGPILIQMDQILDLFLAVCVTFNRFHGHMFKCLKFSLLSVQYTKFWTFLIQKANFGPFCIKMEKKLNIWLCKRLKVTRTAKKKIQNLVHLDKNWSKISLKY